MIKQPNHANEPGYRYCAICCLWRPEEKFACAPLATDRLHPLCLEHVTQKDADIRTQGAYEKLRKARLHPSCPIVVGSFSTILDSKLQ